MSQSISDLPITASVPRAHVNVGTWIVRILLFLVITFLFSKQSQLYLALGKGGKNYIPEVLIPVIWMLLLFDRESANEFKDVLTSPQLLPIIGGLFALLVLGFVSTTDPVGPYVDFRSSVVMFLCFFAAIRMGKYWGWKSEDVIFPIALVGMPLVFLSEFQRIDVDNSGKNPATLFAALLVLHIAAPRQRLFWFVYGLIGLVIVAMLSGYRNDWLISGMAAIVYIGRFIWGRGSSTRSRIKALGLAATVGLLLVVGFTTNIVGNIFHLNSNLAAQTLQKGQALIQLLQGQRQANEDERPAYMESFIVNPEDYILPHGLGWRSFSTVSNKYGTKVTSRYMAHLGIPNAGSVDCGYFFFGFHYGLVLVFYGLYRLALWVFRRPGTAAQLAGPFMVIGVYLLSNFFAMTNVNHAAFFGLFLGLVFKDALTIPKQRQQNAFDGHTPFPLATSPAQGRSGPGTTLGLPAASPSPEA